ncbi:MAG: FAD-dependent thymidylate synthase [SAR324 cluster bacterium]|nr:FAD-dependent thymidylate synthase [SAR324 cluster bacterium]
MTKTPSSDLSVTFLGCSKDPLEILFSAYKISHSSDDATEIWQSIQNGEIDREMMHSCISQYVSEGHLVPLRQAQFVFVIKNISQISVSQVNRQQIELGKNNISQGYLDLQYKGQNVVTPPSFHENPELLQRWSNLKADIITFYKYCRENGIEPADAGFVLPQGLQCQEQISFSFKSMQNFLDQRLCENTQWEINEMSWKIFQIMEKEFPSLAKRLGIKCWENRNLFCDEPCHIYKTCRWGKTRPHKNDFNSLWVRDGQDTAQTTPM